MSPQPPQPFQRPKKLNKPVPRSQVNNRSQPPNRHGGGNNRGNRENRNNRNNGNNNNGGNHNNQSPSPWLNEDRQLQPNSTASFVEYLRWMREPEREYKDATKIQILQLAQEKANYSDRLLQLQNHCHPD